MNIDFALRRAKIARLTACLIAGLSSSMCLFAQENESAEDIEENEEVSSALTSGFVPTYKEYDSDDTTRTPSINFNHFKDKQLVFFDNFKDNRHTWPHWSSSGDSILRECVGIDRNYFCRGSSGELANAYTNLEEGQKVMFCFTPDKFFRYTNNVQLSKNYVVTFNPLSIKRVDKLPPTYYEGFAEHYTRIHNDFSQEDFVIETRLSSAVGQWGMIFGDFQSNRPYYYFKLKTDNSWSFYAVYQNNKENPVELESGYLPVSHYAVKDVAIRLEENGQGGFAATFLVNDVKCGNANVTRMPLRRLDIGYRMDHNSIDGNNIAIFNSLSVYEIPVETYLEKTLNISGKWTGHLIQNGEPLYNITAKLTEEQNGNIYGRVEFAHAKFKDIKISKKLRGHREKNVVNFEDLSYSQKGISSKMQRHSLLQKGNMELFGPDSMTMESFLASSLHRYGNYDNKLNIHSNKIHLSRLEKTRIRAEESLDSVISNQTIEIKDLFFLPNLSKLAENKATKQSLDNLARGLQRYLARTDYRLVIIHGHTDIGGEQVLSITRAHAIKGELMKRGVEADFLCIGHGSSQRVSGVRGDLRNRRVEVEVMTLDNGYVEDDNLILQEGAKGFFIKKLPDEFIINADFKLDPSGKHYVIMNRKGDGENLKWEIPNIAGGDRQSLKIIKRYNTEEDAIVLEIWLDGINMLRQSITNYADFGFEIESGKMVLENLNIFSPN